MEMAKRASVDQNQRSSHIFRVYVYVCVFVVSPPACSFEGPLCALDTQYIIIMSNIGVHINIMNL